MKKSIFANYRELKALGLLWPFEESAFPCSAFITLRWFVLAHINISAMSLYKGDPVHIIAQIVSPGKNSVSCLLHVILAMPIAYEQWRAVGDSKSAIGGFRGG